MKVLYIGGTGQISFDCIHESVRAGQTVYVYNRGNSNDGLPSECNFIQGDIHDDNAYSKLTDYNFDAICQFHLFTPEEITRDIELFTGHCGQYLFISSASAYEKPVRHYLITEDVPLINPYWDYSAKKAPSHTSRTKLTTAMGEGDSSAHRMLAGKPILVPGDGTSLWTITHSTDFAPPFVKLLGNQAALNEDFHLTSDHAYMWNEIYAAIGRALDVEPTLVHVPTDTLIRYNPAWTGPLLGDKTWSVIFDNSKIKSVVGDFTCNTTLDQFMERVMPYFHERAAEYVADASGEALMDRIIEEQLGLGG